MAASALHAMEGGVDWSTARDALHRLDVLTATTDRANQGLESDVMLAAFERCVAEWCACWLVPRVRMRVKRLLRLGFHGFHSTCR